MELTIWLRGIEASFTDICPVQFAFLINGELQRSSRCGDIPAVGSVQRHLGGI